MDDISSEILPYVIEKLMNNGALDAYLTPIIMKKGRPAYKLSVLTNENICKKLESIIFNETKTLGIRKYKADRILKKREEKTIEIKDFGAVRVKYNLSNSDEIISIKPEFEDCKKIAIDKELPLKDVITKFQQVIQKTYH